MLRGSIIDFMYSQVLTRQDLPAQALNGKQWIAQACFGSVYECVWVLQSCNEHAAG